MNNNMQQLMDYVNTECRYRKDQTICEEADRIVSEERIKQYGHPLDNFTDIGRVWGMILGIPDIDPETVGLMMVGLKVARQKHEHDRDNIVDIAGYSKTIDLIKQERIKRDEEYETIDLTKPPTEEEEMDYDDENEDEGFMDNEDGFADSDKSTNIDYTKMADELISGYFQKIDAFKSVLDLLKIKNQ